jgi:hypothetical protein
MPLDQRISSAGNHEMKVSPVDWMLRALIMFIIVAAAIRAAGLVRFSTDERFKARDELEVRQLLELPDNHRLQRLVISADALQGASVLWTDASGSVVATVPDAQGRLRISRGLALSADITAHDLSELDPSDWSLLPPQLSRLTVHVWDATSPVYVTVGSDGKPGIAGVDDDGDGVVDDLGELGATGSDDEVVAPGQPGYLEAASGKIEARIISRGALVATDSDLQLPSHPTEPAAASGAATASPAERAEATEVWWEFTGTAAPIRLCLQVD